MPDIVKKELKCNNLNGDAVQVFARMQTIGNNNMTLSTKILSLQGSPDITAALVACANDVMLNVNNIMSLSQEVFNYMQRSQGIMSELVSKIEELDRKVKKLDTPKKS